MMKFFEKIKNKMSVRSSDLHSDSELHEKRDLVTRTYQLRFDSVDESARSVEATIASETPVMVLDWNRFEVIEEVLVMSGCEIPASRQVPMLDTHDRSSVQSQLGSTRELRIENGRLVGRNYFADTPRGRDAFELIKDNHLQDNSIGYRILESVIIDRGKSAEVNGRTFQASPDRNLRVASKWAVKENSVCAVGADALAKNRKGHKMPKNTHGKNNDTPGDRDDINKGIEMERRRSQEIQELGSGLNIPSETIQRAITEGETTEKFKTTCLDTIRENGANEVELIPGGIHVGDDLNVRSLPFAISDAILSRAGVPLYKEDSQGNIVMESGSPVVREKHSRADQFLGKRIPDIARILLVQAGVSGAADFGDRRAVQKALEPGLRSGISTMYLPTILGNAMGRSLKTSYVELQPQWQKFATKTTHDNFKEITRVSLGEIEDVVQIPEGGEYKYGTVGESKEVYQLAKYGKIFGISWESLINDNLSAFVEIPRKLSAAARRKEDDLVFGVLVGTDAMNDGTVLFHSDHGNLAGSGAVISIDTLNAAKLAFRMQKGHIAGEANVDGTGVDEAHLNLVPTVLIVPAAIEGHSTQLLDSKEIQHSLAGSTDDEKITFSSNPWHKKLELCVHPVLDGTSTTAWFLSTGQSGGGNF